MKKRVNYIIDEPFYCPLMEPDDIDSDEWWCTLANKRAPCGTHDFGDECPLEDAE